MATTCDTAPGVQPSAMAPERSGSHAGTALLIWALCLFGGLAVGFSGFSAESNHPTYLPPGLHYLDPSFLAKDWWLGTASHYHPAFFVLTAVLTKMGVLEWGLALLNVTAVSVALHGCYRIMQTLAGRIALPGLVIMVAFLLASRSFYSAGNAYLFSPSLQPSCIASAATIWAMAFLLERRLVACGLAMAAAGLFHANFLVLNLGCFGTAYAVLDIQERGLWPLFTRRRFLDLVRLLGPSLVLAACFAPLILSVAGERLTQEQAAMADGIFFQFAAPYHYYPLAYLPTLVVFFCWQAIGLAWTQTAVPDPAQRRAMWALQAAIALIVWTATALTTIVFIAPVSRLFLWRLASFGMLLAAIMVVLGALRLIAAPRDCPRPERPEWTALIAGLALLPMLSQFGNAPKGQVVTTGGQSPEILLLSALLLLAGLRMLTGKPLLRNPVPAGCLLAATLGVTLLVQPNDGHGSRYSLLTPAAAPSDETALYYAARRLSPADAQFLVPPDLEYFRLKAGRAIVVDFKAVPMNRSSILGWYQRLADISGVARPADMEQVARGYDRIDTARLEVLRRKYDLGYLVVTTGQKIDPPGWSEIYRNASYRLLAHEPA